MDDELLDLFGAVANGFHARLQGLAVLDELGLAPFQARTLSLISRYPGCSQQALSISTGRDKAQVARAIKELETRGLITRQAHRRDWRAQSLSVTPEGKQASKLLLRHRAQAGAAILQDLNLKEREVLRRALSKMRARLAANGGLLASHDS
jgi:MarR family transcriptional regulator, temperature-dependent positive regulator of motility